MGLKYVFEVGMEPEALQNTVVLRGLHFGFQVGLGECILWRGESFIDRQA